MAKVWRDGFVVIVYAANQTGRSFSKGMGMTRLTSLQRFLHVFFAVGVIAHTGTALAQVSVATNEDSATVIGATNYVRNGSFKEPGTDELSLAELVKSYEREKGFSGVVLVRFGDDQVLVLSAGKRNASENNTADTLFEIGSCTKPITAVACLRLQQLGKLSVNDRISEYLVDVPDHCAEITIRHLLQHTSGIAGTSYGVPTNDAAEFVRASLNAGPQRPPGTQYEYWNQGYSLLAAIIERATGKTYMDAVRELVFEPAGMNEACFTGDGERTMAAIGKSTLGPSRSAMDHPYAGFYGYQYKGMGGAVLTVGGFDRFLTAIADPSFLSQELASQMITTEPYSYGLGWFVTQIASGQKDGSDQKRVYHGGSVRGFLAAVSWYPDQPYRLIVMSNDDNRAVFSELEDALRRQVEARFLPARFDAELVKAITGDYAGRLPNGRVLLISISGDSQSLNSTIDWGGGLMGRGTLEPGEKDQLWLVDGSPEKAEIRLEWSNDRQQIEALNFLNTRFPRK